LNRQNPAPVILLCLFTICAVAFVLIRVFRSAGEASIEVQERAHDDLNSLGLVLGSHDEYVGSEACRDCHPQQFESWHDSYHRAMTQAAAPGVILAPGDEVQLTAFGRTYRVWEDGEDFWVEMPDPEAEAPHSMFSNYATPPEDLPYVRRRIVMTTGSHHYQAYWVRGGPGNELRQFPFVYHREEQRWIPKHEAFLQPPLAAPVYSIWNEVCIQCHSVAGQPGLDDATGSLVSRAVELGIACESCHGPGRQHVAKRQTNPADANEPDDTIVSPATLSHEPSSQVCGQCHAYFAPKDTHDWWDHGYSRTFRPGMELTDSRYLLTPESAELPELEELLEHGSGLDSLYWPDGTARGGGREYLGMVKSACYLNGEMSCLSCHSLHKYADAADQLAGDVDQACLTCHPGFRDSLETHTHHQADSAGSSCINCHMPYTSYALFKSIRSHRVDSPVVRSAGQGHKPNACNLCHLDRTLAWTAEALSEWYGRPEAPLAEDERSIAASLLWMHQGDAAQRAIAAAAAGNPQAQSTSGDAWLIPHLAELLNDPYSAVRMVTWRSLRTLPTEEMSYDFLAPESERIRTRDGLQSQRYEVHLPAAAESLQELLFLPEGEIDRAALSRLRQRRDDRELRIAE